MFLFALAQTLVFPLTLANAAPPQSKVARLGDYEVKQLVVPGFEQLPLRRKLFAYYLSEAMEAGRDIAWEQLSPNGLALRQLFESLWPKLKISKSPFREALEKYYFLLLLNHGPHDQNSNEKNLLSGLTPEEFTEFAVSLGGDREEIVRLLPDLFDPELGRYRVAREGFDKISDSGTAFYGPGVTESALLTLPEEQQRDFLSTPVVSPDGSAALTLQKHALNGRFSSSLRSVAHFLKSAREYGTPEEVELIDAHLKTIQTGDVKDQEAAERLWVKYKPTDISFVIGFTETYDDPLEARGTWEGFLLLKNVDDVARARNQRIRSLASEFEKRMPVDEEFKKTGEFVVPESEGANMMYFSGGHNERSFRGVNLPNSSEIREELGSQSFTAYNKVFDLGEEGAQEFEPGALDTFYLPRYHNMLERFGRGLPLTIQVEFHEILGHGSGRDRTGVDSSKALGSDYSAMEEARAEIAALYTLTDPDYLLAEEILPVEYSKDEARSFAETTILEFFTEHIGSYVDLKGRTDIRQAHQLGRQMILNRALHDGALEVSRGIDGVPRVQLGSLAEMRESFGGFWKDIQRLKSTGDAPGLRSFIATMGEMSPLEQKWARALTDAKERLKLPKFTLYMNPRLEPIIDSKGNFADVEIRYKRSGGDYRQIFDREQHRWIEERFRKCDLELAGVALD